MLPAWALTYLPGVLKWGLIAIALWAGYTWITSGARTEERNKLKAEWYEQQAIDTRSAMDALGQAYERDKQERERWQRVQAELEKKQTELGERILARHREDFRQLNEVLAREPNGACAQWGARPIDCPISWSVQPLPATGQTDHDPRPGFVCRNPACVLDRGADPLPYREADGESGTASAVEGSEGAR